MPEVDGPQARGAKETEGWVGGTLRAKGWTVVDKVTEEAGASSTLSEFPSILAVALCQNLPERCPHCFPLPVAS